MWVNVCVRVAWYICRFCNVWVLCYYVYLCLLCFVLFVPCFLYCFVYEHLLLFVLSVLVYGLLPSSDISIAVNNNNDNNNNNNIFNA